MPNAIFTASFEKFNDSVQQATLKLKSFEGDAVKVGKSLDSLGNALSGKKLIQDATLMASAVEKLGGVSLLTEKELQRVGAQAQEAAEKMTKLGIGVPENLQKIAAAAKEASTKLEQAAKPTGALAGWFGDLGKQVVATAAGFISAQAVIGSAGAAFHAFTGFISDSVTAFSDAEAAHTKLTAALKAGNQATPETIRLYDALATQFQRTTTFSDDAINSVEALLVSVGQVMPNQMRAALTATTNLAAGLGIDLQEAALIVAKGFSTGGDSLGKFKAILGDALPVGASMGEVLDAINAKFGNAAADQIDTYAGKIQQLTNDWNNFQEAVGKAIVQSPLTTEGIKAIADETVKLSEAAAKGEGSLAGLLNSLNNLLPIPSLGLNSLAAFVALLERLAKAGEKPPQFDPNKFIAPSSSALPAGPTVSDPEKLTRFLAAIKTETASLTAVQKEAALAAFNQGLNVAQTTKALEDQWPSIKKNEAAVASLHEVWQKNKTDSEEAAKKFDAAWKELTASGAGLAKTLESVDLMTQVTIEHYLDAGESVEILATAFKLTKGQVEAIKDKHEALAKVLVINTTATDDLSAAVEHLGKVDQQTIPLLKQRADALDRIHAIETFSGKAVGFIDTSGLKLDVETVGQLLDRFKKLDDQTKGFKQTLSGLASAFVQLAQIGGGAFTDIGRAVGGAIGQFQLLNTALETVNKTGASTGTKIAGVASAFSSVASVAFIAADIAESFDEPIFRSIMRGVGEEWGIAISEGVAHGIEASREQVQRDLKTAYGPSANTGFRGNLFGRLDPTAELLNLSQALTESGALNAQTFDKFFGILINGFSLIDRQLATTGEMTKVLDDNWALFEKAGTDALGFINKDLKDLITLNEQYGTQSKEIAAFQSGQADKVVAGFTAVSGGLKEQVGWWDQVKQAVTDATKAIDDATTAGDAVAKAKGTRDLAAAMNHQQEVAKGATRQLDDLGTQAAGAFGAAMKGGKTFNDAIAAIGPGLDPVLRGIDDLGLKASDFGHSWLLIQAQMQRSAPQLAAAVGGLGNELVGLSNLGMLNADTFGAIERTGADMFTRLQGEAAKFGGGQKDALLPMQEFLHQAQKAAEDLGMPLDDNTQMLIDQSKELGIWKDAGETAAEKQVKAFGRIADSMGVVADKLTDIADKLNTLPDHKTITIDTSYTDHTLTGAVKHWGGMVGVGDNILRFLPRAHRGLAIDERLIVAQTGEAVLNRAATAHLGIDTIHALNKGGTLGSGGGAPVVEVHIHNILDGREVSETIERRVGSKVSLRKKQRAA